MAPSSVPPRTSLRGLKLFETLREISRTAKTGTLEFRRGDARASIGFLQGRMLYPQGQSLSAFLIREGKLSRDKVQNAQKQQNSQEGFARTLIRTGCLTEEDARTAAHTFLDQQLRAVALWPDGTMEFREAKPEEKTQDSWGSCPTLARILAVVRSIEDSSSLFPDFQRSDAVISLLPGMEALMGDLELKPEEGYLLSRITTACTLGELFALSPLDPERTRKLLCGLQAAGILEGENGSGPAPVAGPSPRTGETPAPTARKRKSLLGTKKKKTRKRRSYRRKPFVPSPVTPAPVPVSLGGPEALQQKLEELETQDFYQMLGVNSVARADDIRKNYYNLARHFHPDRFHRSGKSDLAEKAEKLLSHITEAYAILSDPQARMHYDQEKAERSRPKTQDTRSDKSRVAQENHQRGLQLLHSGQLQKAVNFLENAVGMDPNNDEYLCDLAQVQMRNPKLREEARGNLQKAISLNPSRAENYLNLGLLLQREGNLEKATKMFEEAATWDPGNERIQKLIKEVGSKRKGGRFSGLFGK